MTAPNVIPLKVKDAPRQKLGGNGNGQSYGGGNGDLDAEPPVGWPRKRTSIFPLLLDVGAVTAMFGLIILWPLAGPLTGQLAVGGGVTLAVIALIGWGREAYRDYSQMRD